MEFSVAEVHEAIAATRPDAECLVFRDRRLTWADVTEGSGGVWERLKYDWSDPTRVTMKTTDSNIWGGASGHTYALTRRPDGRTDVDVVVVRDGKTLKGHFLAVVLKTVGKGVLAKALANTVKVIEARNSAAPRNAQT